MNSLKNQINSIWDKMESNKKTISDCEILKTKGAHNVKSVGYYYGKIDFVGTIGRLDVYRCKCGFEVIQPDKATDVPKGYELNKLYSYGNIQAR